MENWSNLSLYLNKSNENQKRVQLLSRQLIEACLQNDKELIKKSLKSGAPVNTHDEHLTPLIVSIQNDNSDLGAYLLMAGASISYKPTLNFEDAFWYSLTNKKYNFLQLFVSSRCLLEWSTPKNDKDTPKTPLIFSVINSDLKAVIILLKHHNIKVNERDGFGNTALHYNVAKPDPSSEDLEIGRLLIAAGADESIVNLEGKSAKDISATPESQSVLLSGKLDNELTVNEVVEEELDFDTPSLKTKGGKLKI